MLIPSYANGLEFYSYADAIRNWCQAGIQGTDRPYFYGLTAQFLKWFNGDREPAAQLRYAYNACKALCEAYRQRCEANTCLSNLHWPPKPAEATEASDAA